MMRKRLYIQWSETLGYHVPLPTYVMVPGSFRSNNAALITPHGVTKDADPQRVIAAQTSVECEIPDQYCDPHTRRLEMHRVADAHRNLSQWANAPSPAVEDDNS